jgi:hypothetical protein
MAHKKTIWGNKIRVTLCLSTEQWQKLEQLYNEAQISYGPGASRSRIIGKMILDAGDKIERKREAVKELNRRFQRAQEELYILEEEKKSKEVKK